MHDKSGVVLIAVLAAFGLFGFAAVVFSRTASSQDNRPTSVRSLPQPNRYPTATGPANSAEWLSSMRPYWNPVDVETRLAWSPVPEGQKERCTRPRVWRSPAGRQAG